MDQITLITINVQRGRANLVQKPKKVHSGNKRKITESSLPYSFSFLHIRARRYHGRHVAAAAEPTIKAGNIFIKKAIREFYCKKVI